MNSSLLHLLRPFVRTAAALIGTAFLVLNAQALDPNPLVGTPFNATINFHTPLNTTLLGNQSGFVGGGYEVQLSVPQANNGWIGIDLNPESSAWLLTHVNALFTYDLGLGTTNWVSVHIDFPSLSALGFSGIYNFYHDATWGASSLSIGVPPNSLEFVFSGSFLDPYGFTKTDQWGYSMQPNPAGPPDQSPGAGNVAVPEPSTYGLLGSLALLGLGAMRKRNQKTLAAARA